MAAPVHEIFLDAWQFGGEVLDLGFTCRRLHRYRLSNIADLERRRWRVLWHVVNYVKPREEEALAWLRKLDVAYFRDEEDNLRRFTPNGNFYKSEWVRSDRSLPPLMQLAEIPEVSDEQLRCGDFLVRMYEWAATYLRRERCVNAALAAGLYADRWIREGVERAGRARVLVNGRDYLVTGDWGSPRIFDGWPRPEDMTFEIGS